MSDRLDAAVAELVAALREELMAKARPTGPVRLLSIEEACEATGLSRTSLYGALRRGELRSIIVGRRRLIPADAIADMGNR